MSYPGLRSVPRGVPRSSLVAKGPPYDIKQHFRGCHGSIHVIIAGSACVVASENSRVWSEIIGKE